jgi:hypothetical protein
MNNTAATIRPRLTRHNGACSVCKARVSVAVNAGSSLWLQGIGCDAMASVSGPVFHVSADQDGFWVPTVNGAPVRECCGRQVALRGVVGRFKPDHKCDARCRVSKGFVCDCACGGANHGCG